MACPCVLACDYARGSMKRINTMKIHMDRKHHDGKIHKNRKEDKFTDQYAVITSDFREILIVRIYSTNACNYCCIWLNDSKKGIHLSGGAYAGGYGYHRPSQAMQSALNDAHIFTSENIGGVGETGMREAMEAIANKLGYRKFKILRAQA